MPHRQEQLESALRRAIGQILLTGMSDPRIRGMISVTAVKVSPDRREAVVSISVLPAEHQQLTVTALDHAARHIQAEVSKRIEIRQMPHLHFKVDETLKKQAAVLGAISQAMLNTPSGPLDTSGGSGGNEEASS